MAEWFIERYVSEYDLLLLDLENAWKLSSTMDAKTETIYLGNMSLSV